MGKIVVNKGCKGLLFRGGKFRKILEAGVYTEIGSKKIEIAAVNGEFLPENCDVKSFVGSEPTLASYLETITVPDDFIALHFVDGVFDGDLTSGFHAFWKEYGKHEFRLYDMSGDVPEEIPDWLKRKLVYFGVCVLRSVPEGMKARLYIDGKFVSVLDSGVYYFWKNRDVETQLVDTRLRQAEVVGQEMLTADRVTVRINFVCRYKITDYVGIAGKLENFDDQFRSALQLVIRGFVCNMKMDELLDGRSKLSEDIFAALKKKEGEFCVEIVDAGIKDIILPGEIREIMNTVLIAEKQAQANVIARREEVASTRSLLNTAKLLEENETLRRLKEYEYVERICKNVGNVSLSGSGDILSQLADLLKTKN